MTSVCSSTIARTRSKRAFWFQPPAWKKYEYTPRASTKRAVSGRRASARTGRTAYRAKVCGGGHPSAGGVMAQVTRAQAQALLFEFTQSEALRRHGRAVEEAMRG